MRILAIERELPTPPYANFHDLLRDEAASVWDLLKGGVIRDIWFTATEPRAVIMLECVNAAEARQHLAALPLVRHGLIECRNIPRSLLRVSTRIRTLPDAALLGRLCKPRVKSPDFPRRNSSTKGQRSIHPAGAAELRRVRAAFHRRRHGCDSGARGAAGILSATPCARPPACPPAPPFGSPPAARLTSSPEARCAPNSAPARSTPPS